MAKVLENIFHTLKQIYWNVILFFFLRTDIYVTKICSSYVCVYVSLDILDILIAENISS